MKISILPLVFSSLLAVNCFAASLDENLQQAQQSWEQGNTEQAQQQFEQAIKDFPESAQAHMKLAGFYLGQQQHDASIGSYQQAISLYGEAQPQDMAKAFIGLGLAYMHSQRSSLALAAFAEASRLDPQRQAQLAPLVKQLEEKKAAAEKFTHPVK